MFEREVFRKQMYCIEESICDTVGIFGAPRSRSDSAPHSDSTPEDCVPFPPSLRPCSAVRDSGVDLHDTRGVTRLLDGVRGKN